MNINNNTFRQATQADETAVKALIKEVGINPMGIHWQHFLLVVDEEDHLVGCGQIKPHKDGSRELASIAVQREWRNQGVAKRIITQLMAEEERPLWLMCRSPLALFYAPFGFVEVRDLAEMPPYFRRVARFVRALTWVARKEPRLAVMVWR